MGWDKRRVIDERVRRGLDSGWPVLFIPVSSMKKFRIAY